MGVEMCEFDQKRVDFAEEIKREISSNIEIHNVDYREIELSKFQCIFVNNAATDHLGVEDYEILSSAILSGTDVFLRYGWYGKDNRIFDELDANNRIKRENYNEIIRYSSK